MEAIEPNWVSSLWFAAFATICTVAFLVVAGMFPLRSRPDSARSGGVTLLIVGNATLLAALALGTALYGYTELRWSTLIVVAGLAVLFTPGLFEAFPSSLRDGRTGLVVLVGVQILALAGLARVAGPSLTTLS
jgi:predicted permease